MSGHTHELSIEKAKVGNGLFINPGSATGAPTLRDNKKVVPSFVLVDVQGPRIVTYSYRLVNDVSFEQISYTFVNLCSSFWGFDK